MKVFVSYQYIGVDKDKLKSNLSLLEEELANKGHDHFIFWGDLKEPCAHSLVPELVLETVFSELDNCDALVALINSENISECQALELGYARAKGIPIYIYIEEGIVSYLKCKISANVYYFQNSSDMVQLIRSHL